MGNAFFKKTKESDKPNSDNEMLNIINELFRQHKLVLFSKTFCPYCRTAKNVLKATGFKFHAVELDEAPNGAKMQKEISKLSGINTVPQLFLDSKFVGDSSTVKKLNESGKLVEMFIEHEVPRA